jgi:hypothetical protein
MRPRKEKVKRHAMGIRINEDILIVAEKAAEESHRSVSNLIELALIRFLQAEGYIPRAPSTISGKAKSGGK